MSTLTSAKSRAAKLCTFALIICRSCKSVRKFAMDADIININLLLYEREYETQSHKTEDSWCRKISFAWSFCWECVKISCVASSEDPLRKSEPQQQTVCDLRVFWLPGGHTQANKSSSQSAFWPDMSAATQGTIKASWERCASYFRITLCMKCNLCAMREWKRVCVLVGVEQV